jgi:hypothetical protein
VKVVPFLSFIKRILKKPYCIGPHRTDSLLPWSMVEGNTSTEEAQKRMFSSIPCSPEDRNRTIFQNTAFSVKLNHG